MRLPTAPRAAACALVLAAVPGTAGVPAFAQGFAPPLVVTIDVDAREAPRHLFHARMRFDVERGPLELSSPKWLQGDHGPSGPVGDIVGLRFTTEDGQPLAWERDSTDWWTVRVETPPGRVIAHLDYADVTAEVGTSAKLGLVPWPALVLAPRGIDAARLRADASLRPPAGWTAAGAIPMTAEDGGASLRLADVSLATLVDSPVLLGAHGTTIELAPGHRVAIYGDTPESIVPPPALVEGWRRLVREGLALFAGPLPYRHYVFLLALSDEISHFGIEHHESSVNRMPERMLIDESPRLINASLLPHEFVHAWNGKYRRPAGLITPDFARPMNTEMVWVYEGLTEYWGWVLAGRSGLLTPEEARDELALTAAVMDSRAGRAWRPLRDTGTAAHLLYSAGSPYLSMRRGTDFYGEAHLVWLDVDATIRTLSRGRRSLDDLARTFFVPPAAPEAGADGPLPVVPYTGDELIAALEHIQPHDWRAFFDARVNKVAPRIPLGGLEQSGYTLAFRDSVTPYLAAYEEVIEKTDLRFSLGVRLDDEGAIDDVIPDSPAGRAGLAPREVLVAVNGRTWTPTLLEDALAATARDSTAGLVLLVRNGTFLREVPLAGVRGDRRPWLARRPRAPDGLARILAPRAAATRSRRP